MPTKDEETCIRVCKNETVRGFPEVALIGHASLKSLGRAGFATKITTIIIIIIIIIII